ncbi:Methylated-DNA--protein-cysteine methyltransferase, constitutive [bioreactor metagenome]|uniref:methylated-DNA--[protein]-cysteine S-methyltransferase n=1 Tax=bioreactor metagenome TaxID=1076179 RepID=A0A645A005_9ZZZZ
MTKFSNDIVHTRFATPLGDMFAAASGSGIVGLWFHDQRHLPPQLAADNSHAAWPRDDHHPLLVQARQQAQEYLRGERSGFDLPLDLSAGTAFQQSVWQALLRIPRGKTTSYGSLARTIGNVQAVRAVGAAVGRNPLSVAVPCHRVLGSDGGLTGYAGGLERKTALLRLEGVATPEPITS